MLPKEIGWVFIYVFAFGFSDMFRKKFIKTDRNYIMYYLFLGAIGISIICGSIFKII